MCPPELRIHLGRDAMHALDELGSLGERRDLRHLRADPAWRPRGSQGRARASASGGTRRSRGARGTRASRRRPRRRRASSPVRPKRRASWKPRAAALADAPPAVGGQNARPGRTGARCRRDSTSPLRTAVPTGYAVDVGEQVGPFGLERPDQRLRVRGRRVVGPDRVVERDPALEVVHAGDGADFDAHRRILARKRPRARTGGPSGLAWGRRYGIELKSCPSPTGSWAWPRSGGRCRKRPPLVSTVPGPPPPQGCSPNDHRLSLRTPVGGRRATSPPHKRMQWPLLARHWYDRPVAGTAHLDVLVVGSGASGLAAAVSASRAGARVAIAAKGTLQSCNSAKAQGGIQAAFGEDDSPEIHAEDVWRSSHETAERRLVEVLTSEAPGAIHWLEELGVEFTRDNGGYRLARCGGASRKRLLQVGDRTGHAITKALREAVEGHRWRSSRGRRCSSWRRRRAAGVHAAASTSSRRRRSSSRPAAAATARRRSAASCRPTTRARPAR